MINGVETIVFSARDPADLVRFFRDFGLSGEEKGTAVEFTLPEGSHVIVRKDGDAVLPPAFLPGGEGPREVIWGVDGAASLDAVERELRRDRDVTKDADGTLHTVDPSGLRIGFRIFARRSLPPHENKENTQTDRPRWNTPRQWFDRAKPKVIQHVVFAIPDIDPALDFYVKRLGFRISDVSRGRGIFLRAEGRNEHHNLFFVKRPLGFHHMAFGLDSIDELMVGANHMQRQGWTSNFGLGRHRVSSIVFFYMSCPTGGEIEYAADGDYIDDNWKPQLWEPAFANQYWMAGPQNLPPTEIGMGARSLPQPIPPFSELQ